MEEIKNTENIKNIEELKIVKKTKPKSKAQNEAWMRTREKLKLKWDESRKRKDQYKENIKKSAIDRKINKNIDNYKFSISDEETIDNETNKQIKKYMSKTTNDDNNIIFIKTTNDESISNSDDEYI